jgi:hypothetical protein
VGRDQTPVASAAPEAIGKPDNVKDTMPIDRTNPEGPIRVNRAFWIKLARLAAITEELDEHRAALEQMRPRIATSNLPPADINRLAAIRRWMEDLAWFD